MEYKIRTYREHFREGRWTNFIVKCKDSDLWIEWIKLLINLKCPNFVITYYRNYERLWKLIAQRSLLFNFSGSL